MGILVTPARRRAAAAFTCTVIAAATAISGASAASATPRPATHHPASSHAAAGHAAAGHAAAGHPAAPVSVKAVNQAVSSSAQRATQAFWTPAAMKAATPLAVPEPYKGTPGPPPRTPHPSKINGVPTVGALFMTTGLKRHFCTASVVNSLTANLVLTAAHCVYGSSAATHIEFVPEYHDGLQPYGGWPVQTVTVASGWQIGRASCRERV